MKISTSNGQLTFDEIKGSLKNLPKTNRWVQLGDSLPWDEYEKFYLKHLNNDKKGAANKPARLIIGALIVKHKLNLSDRETILAIQENPYIQYFLGLEEFTDQPIFDASLFVTIRKRITIEDINAFTLQLQKKLKDKKDKDKDNHDSNSESPKKTETQDTDIKVDATCANAEVKYPTDLDLLEDASKFLARLNLEISRITKESVLTLNRFRIREVYLGVIKRKHKGKKLIDTAKRKILHWLHVDILKLTDKLDSGTFSRLNRTKQRTLLAIYKMWTQQNTMFHTGVHTCSDRIISIHQPHLRPIIRGKAKAKVEFGAKIGVSIVSGFTYIDHHSWDAYNEASDFDTHIKLFKERFGKMAHRFFGDKIYLNKENRKKMKGFGIECMGRALGRPPKNQTEEQREREIIGVGLRNEVEATFGTSKRVYRADNIRAKLPDTAQCWTAMCYFVKNLTKFMRELCRLLTEILHFLNNKCYFLAFFQNFLLSRPNMRAVSFNILLN
jgi:hypothetical protein